MIVQSWDTAYKDKEINDPSVCTTWLVSRFGYWLLHVYRDRLDYPSVKRAVKSMAAAWSPNVVLIEDKASGQSLIQELRSETRLSVVAIEPDGDKVTRANSCSGICEAGRVHLPEVAEWLMEFELELFAFPLSTTKDQVDSVSQFLNWIHAKSVQLEAWGTGQQRAGLHGFNNQHQSQIDENTGYGIVRSDNDTSGF
jgi:predicted phage terminase large subunit-like protein